jgi:hypothetical protein
MQVRLFGQEKLDNLLISGQKMPGFTPVKKILSCGLKNEIFF